MNTITNTGTLYTDNTQSITVTSASGTATVESDEITMTKTADKTDEYYFSGEPITFTITINNSGTLAANGLFFSDTMPNGIVPSSGTDFTVVASVGTVTSSSNPITISGIDIPAGGNATITISGVIA